MKDDYYMILRINANGTSWTHETFGPSRGSSRVWKEAKTYWEKMKAPTEGFLEFVRVNSKHSHRDVILAHKGPVISEEGRGLISIEGIRRLDMSKLRDRREHRRRNGYLPVRQTQPVYVTRER